MGCKNLTPAPSPQTVHAPTLLRLTVFPPLKQGARLNFSALSLSLARRFSAGSGKTVGVSTANGEGRG
jgi:hypothetical protein